MSPNSTQFIPTKKSVTKDWFANQFKNTPAVDKSQNIQVKATNQSAPILIKTKRVRKITPKSVSFVSSLSSIPENSEISSVYGK